MWLIVGLASAVAFIAGTLVQAVAAGHLIGKALKQLERDGVVRIVEHADGKRREMEEAA